MKKENEEKLSTLTDSIALSINEKNKGPAARYSGDTGYEYSSSCIIPLARHLQGTWKIIEHTVGGIPYIDRFCAATFKDTVPDNLVYEATYEFQHNLCVKRVSITGMVNLGGTPSSYEYRMSAVLICEMKRSVLHALPVQGYQITSINGKPVAVKELPPSTDRITISFHFDDEALVLVDGDDRKRLVKL
jgi:hypothetical protein